MKHHHLIAGMHGCLPNMNEPVATLEEAQGMFKSAIEYELDMLGIPEENVTYNRDLTYATILHGGNEYYEITECSLPVCLEEE